MPTPFRIHARCDQAPEPRADRWVELVLVLALTTPLLILGVAARKAFGVALTVALFSWIFAFVSLARSWVVPRLQRRRSRAR